MSETKQNSGFFYGWWIVGFALVSLVITNGSTIGGLPVFFKPMLDDLQSLGAIDDVTRPQITAFGGALIPLIATPLIAKYGWRLALMGVSCLVFTLIFLVWLIVRVKPSEMGLLPDGDLPSEVENSN